jgi:hypothetical protein
MGRSERTYVENHPYWKRFQEHAQRRFESGYALLHTSRSIDYENDLGLGGFRWQVEFRDEGDHESGSVWDGGVRFEDGGGGRKGGTFY